MMALCEKTLVTLMSMLMSMLMSEISEDAYCASWEMGTEYAIWDVIHGASSDLRWKSSISPDQTIMLRDLSAELDGWIVYDVDSDDYVRLVRMDEWQRIYGTHVIELGRRRKAELGATN